LVIADLERELMSDFAVDGPMYQRFAASAAAEEKIFVPNGPRILELLNAAVDVAKRSGCRYLITADVVGNGYFVAFDKSIPRPPGVERRMADRE
jgi:hypothetical protein